MPPLDLPLQIRESKSTSYFISSPRIDITKPKLHIQKQVSSPSTIETSQVCNNSWTSLDVCLTPAVALELMTLRCPLCPLMFIGRMFFAFVMQSLAIEILVPLSFGCPSCHGLAIFGKLLGFFMQTFAEQAYKPVTLGGSPEKSADPPSHQTVHPTEDGMPREDTKQAGNAEKSAAAVNVVEKDTKELSQVQENGEEKGNATANTAAAGARAPKKMVSISDNVEEINTSKKRDKRKAGIEKLPSLESDKEEVKPLKSILKVGSNVKEKRGREVIPLDNDDLDVHQSIM